MNSDFENRLQRQSFRPVPSEWRDEILRAAQEASVGPTRPQRPTPWWRDWIFAYPRAWAGLAAAWGVILLLSISTQDEPGPPGQTPAVAANYFEYIQQQAEILAKLSGPDDIHSTAPPDASSQKPRSRLHITKPDRQDSAGVGSAASWVAVAGTPSDTTTRNWTTDYT